MRLQSFLLLILLLPSLVSIPTVVEPRFMLPFYFVAYGIVAFFVLPRFLGLPYKAQAGHLRQHALAYGAFVLICFLLSAATFAGLE